jgi:hypothetical protein
VIGPVAGLVIGPYARLVVAPYMGPVTGGTGSCAVIGTNKILHLYVTPRPHIHSCFFNLLVDSVGRYPLVIETFGLIRGFSQVVFSLPACDFYHK